MSAKTAIFTIIAIIILSSCHDIPSVFTCQLLMHLLICAERDLALEFFHFTLLGINSPRPFVFISSSPNIKYRYTSRNLKLIFLNSTFDSNTALATSSVVPTISIDGYRATASPPMNIGLSLKSWIGGTSSSTAIFEIFSRELLHLFLSLLSLLLILHILVALNLALMA